MKKRVKCLLERQHPSAPRHPYLNKGSFYDVIDESVHTMADETPYIKVSDGKRSFDVPRHQFGRILL